MKKLLFFIITFMICASASFAAITALHIHTASHGVITLLLEDEPELTFNEDRSITVEVKADPTAEPVSISFDDVQSCDYGEKDKYSGITKTDANPGDAICVKIGAEAVVFTGIADNAAVEIYNISGNRVISEASADGAFSLRRDIVGHGVYIVRIGKFVTKLSL